MRRLCILAWLATVASACAQWPSGWGLGDFDGRDRALCSYTAVIERAIAAGASTNTIYPPGTFTQRRRLVTYKAFVKDTLIPLYVDLTRTNAAGNFNDYLTNGIQTNLPVYVFTQVCNTATAPTNYFDRTPMFNAGNNTNYGWYPMKAILNQLVATRKSQVGEATELDTNEFGSTTQPFYMLTNVWTDLRQALVDYYAGADGWLTNATAPGEVAHMQIYLGSNAPASYQSEIQSILHLGRGRVVSTSIATNRPHSAAAYVQWFSDWESGYPSTNWVFDARWPTAEYTNRWQLFEGFAQNTTATRTGVTYSNNVLAGLPVDGAGYHDRLHSKSIVTGLRSTRWVFTWDFLFK